MTIFFTTILQGNSTETMSDASRQGRERRCNRCVGRPLLAQCIHTKAGKEFLEQVCHFERNMCAPNNHQQKRNTSVATPREGPSDSISANNKVGLHLPAATIFHLFSRNQRIRRLEWTRLLRHTLLLTQVNLPFRDYWNN